MNHKYISTPGAPSAIGPYSQAVSAGDFLFCSGQIPLDPVSGEIVPGIKEGTARVLKNLEALLSAAGLDLSHVVKTTVYLTDMKNFSEMNEVYSEFFGESRPARACVQVSALPKGVSLEIEAVACKKEI